MHILIFSGIVYVMLDTLVMHAKFTMACAILCVTHILAVEVHCAMTA